jgi:penicillin-binding protein 1A
MNIPNSPGLEPHPAQVAELQRLAELQKAEAAAGVVSQHESIGADGQRHTAAILPDNTRDALKKLAQALRKAGGLPEPAATTPGGAPAAPQSPPAATPPPSPESKGDKRVGTGAATGAATAANANAKIETGATNGTAAAKKNKPEEAQVRGRQ